MTNRFTKEYIEILRRTRTPRNCPRCGAYKRIPIIAGLPGPELEKKAMNGEVILLGCMPDMHGRTWACHECGYWWGNPSGIGCPLFDKYPIGSYKSQKLNAMILSAELVRRYGQSMKLRVCELHPGGGQSYALALSRIDNNNIDMVPMALFKSTYMINDWEYEHGEMFPYVELMTKLVHPMDVATLVGEFLCLGKKPRQTKFTPEALVLFVLAAMLENLSPDDNHDIGNGFYDSSGPGGCHVRSELLIDRILESDLDLGSPDSTKAMMAASQYWLWGSGEEALREPKVAFHLSGKMFFLRGELKEVDIYKRYSEDNVSLEKLVHEIYFR